MSNELYNTIARVTDGIYEGMHMLAILFNFFLILALISVDLSCNLNLNVLLELLQVLQLEEMCSQAPLYLIMFCGLTTSHRYVIAFIYFLLGALPTVSHCMCSFPL